MEDVTAVYMLPCDPDHPLVRPDGTSKQPIAEMRSPIPMKPGRTAGADYQLRNAEADRSCCLRGSNAGATSS